jgi:alkanesulfonate monooxygenase SsuD/methylene tetrahydromethanopterin reductase-like flavin-dependent oxidoreductase (luciferase family)
MSTQRRGVALTPMETRYDIILRTAQLADELGYEAFALPEGWGLTRPCCSPRPHRAPAASSSSPASSRSGAAPRARWR